MLITQTPRKLSRQTCCRDGGLWYHRGTMKNALLVAVLVVIVAIAGYYIFGRPAVAPVPAPTPALTPPPAFTPAPGPTPTQVPAPTPTPQGRTFTISMTAEGFSPQSLTIKMGDRVVFRNDDTKSRWPASAIHPTHQVCPGFDALRPMASAESYSHTFTQAKECPFHDHLTPSLRGKITVTE